MFGEKKEVFGLRKSKVTKSLQGAVLGTAFFIGATATASVASADEAVPATNLTDKQDANFNNTSKTTEGVKDTSAQVNYEPSAEYKQALSDAKTAGVEIVPNDQVVEKEAKDTAEADALKKQLDKDYAAKTEELKAAKEKVEKGGTSSPDYIAYEKAKGEYDKAWADYNKQKAAIEADRKRITEANERIKKENQDIEKENAAKVDEFNKKLKEYVAKAGANYSYLYGSAIEDAIDDDKDTANIWNVDIQGGTPLKTENVDGSLNREYYKTLDPAYWVGKEATTYTKANLGKVEAYAVRLKAGQSITVRYSYKNGQNLRVASDKVFENTNGVETPVKYVEYTYKLDQALTSTGEEIVYVTNDANIPFYRGVSDYSQLNDNGPKSADLPLDGVRKYDTTIRALGADYRPLRLRYLIRQADGSQKPLIDYLDVMNNNLFVNAQKETLVSRKNIAPENLTEEHGTKLDGQFVNIKDVKDLDPDFKNKIDWVEQWSGMLDNKGTGIRSRTFSHPVDTIKKSQNKTTPTTTETVTNYRPGNFEVYASDGTVIPASEYKLEVYPNASSAPTEVKNIIKSGDLNEWGGWKLTFNDANDFYYKYVQNDKNLRVSWTLNPTDGKGEVRTVNQEFDLSKYKNQIAPKEKQITIDVTSTGKGTVTWSYKDADGRTTTAELNEQQYAQKVAEGKADAYLNVTTTDENGNTSTSRKHYTDYFDSIRNPKVKKVTVTQTVHPYWTEPFTFWGAGMMKATSTSRTSSVVVAGQTDVASIGAMHSDFKYTNNAFPPSYVPAPLKSPLTPPDLPTPPSMVEPKKPEPVSARVELLPTYVLKLHSEITKKVKNTDGTDLNDKTVAKGSDVLWELKADNLPAGRKETKKVVFEDVLPDGYELNLSDTTARNPLYDVTYDAKSRKLTFTAKESTLATWNKLLPAASTYAEAEVTSPVISGRVVNDNGNYLNNFVFEVNDGDPKQGGSKTTSKIVKTRTRDVHPVKRNLDANGNDINNLARTHGSTNYYTLTWDLDQYKDIVATENTIRKGFYYFDDFPEEAVIPQSNLITYKLEDGTAVKGITANVYTSVENAPEEIKEVITNANLKFKGAFQVFKADDAKAFFDAYVKTGKNIKIVTPMKVRDDFNSTEMYKNNAFQVDFGNGYYTNEVQNYVVKPPKPRKSNYNAEGVNINGKTMLPGSENHYTLLWDLSSYKGLTSTPDEIANGFYMVDDYPEDILDIVPNGVKITDLDNAPVKGITATVFNSLAEAPENVRKAFEKSTYKPNGRIQVFSADNPEDFYNKYVKTGKSLNVVTVMRVKQELAGRKETYNNTAYQVGYGSAATTETVTNQTPPPPKPDKKVENNEGTDINGKPVILGSTLVYKLGWDLTNFKDISATTEQVDKGFYFIDDFPENELSPKDGWKIVDSKGNVVEDMVSKVYDSVSAAPEAVRTLLTSNKVNINGKFQVFYPNSTIDFYNKYVLKGEKLTIVNPMTVTTTKETKFENRAFQGEFGMVRETNPVHNETPKPKPVKEVQNVDGVNINNSIVPINSTNVYVLTWDLDQYKGIEANKEDVAKGFLYVDDFPEEALTEQDDKVQFKLEDGTEVKGLKAKTYNSLAEVPENLRKLMVDGAITPTGKFQLYVPENNEEFYNTYVKTGKNIKIYSPMVVKNVKDKTEFVNKGFQIDFGSTYKTDEVKNSVRIPEPHKRNLDKDSVDINKVPMHVGSTNYYTMDWDLDQYKGIKADKGLIAKGFHYVDDYPEEAVTINAKDVRVKTLDGKDVTDFVEIKQYASWNEVPEIVKEAFKAKNYVPKGAVQVISAKDATKFYNEFVTTGRSLQIVDPMTVKPEMAGSNKSYYNTAYQVDFGTAYVTETVENPVPNVKPVKKDLNKDGVDINNQVTTKGTVHHYTLTWDLSSYKDSIVPVDEVAKGFYFVDDYPENTVEVLDKEIKLTDNEGKAVEGVTVTTYQKLSDAPKAVQEAVAKSKTTINGTFQVFSADNPTDFYKRYVQTGKTITIVDAMRVKKEFAKEHSVYKNQGFQIEFGNLQATEIVKNEVPEVTPVKRNLNKEKVDINGTPMAIGMDNYYTMTWKLDQYKGMTPSKDQIAKGFMYIDDYPEEAVSLLADQLKVTTPDGKEVKGLTVKVYQSVDELDKETREDFAAWGLNPKGAFQVISADNPEEFYATYVKPGINLTIVDPMRVKDEMRNRENTRYENTAYQWDMGVIAKTDTVYNDVPKVTPKKQNLNKARVDINGKEMLAGSTNYYLHTWDLDQYKGLKADKETIAKGMFFVDDYPEDVVDIIDSEVRVFVEEKTAEGVKETPVSGIKVTKYASLEKAPEVVQNALKEAGYKVNGAIQVFTPEDPQAFYDNYVAKGISLKILDPMTVKEKMGNIGGRYENSAFQIDFGKAQATEIVYNNIPKYSNKKEVKVGDKDVNNSVIELNQTFDYVLNGVQVPADRADKLWDYSFKDNYQESHDLYEGVHNLIASVDFELQVRNEKGEVTDTIKVKKGDNLNKYSIHTFDKDKGIVTVEMTKEFYDMLDNSQPFGADLVLTMKRIASGEVENTFENTVNGVVVKSNTVKTTTPEPKPEPKVPEKPKKPGLPNTGTKASTALVSVGLAGMLAAIGLASRKRRED